MKILIIDDEIGIRKIIIHLFQQYYNEPFEIIEADTVKSGISAVEEQHPDIVLLDIILPDGSGFDLLKQLCFLNFKLIFITAYEEFALKAYGFSAIGFLLKPPDPKKLFDTIGKAKNLLEKENVKLRLNALFVKLDNPVFENNKLELKTDEKNLMISICDIVRCEVEKDCTHFHLLDNNTIITSKNINAYETILDGYGFFRIHSSHLINLKYIDHYKTIKGGAVVMKDNSSLPIARHKKESFLKILEMI